MDDFEDIDLWIKWTQPGAERVARNLRAEIDDNGYTLIALQLQRQQLIIGTTLDLSWSGYPEIASTAEDRQEVLALLQPLVNEAIVHERTFDEGSHSMAFFRELHFSELDSALNAVGIVDEVLQGRRHLTG